MGRLLRGLAVWIGLYVLMTGAHMGALYGLDALRTRYESALETRLGAEAVDREPPYSGGERLIVALDIQPSAYWQESLAMSAIMSLIVALFVGLASLAFRKGRAAKLMLVALVVNGLVFFFFAQLSEQLFAGYLLGQPVSAVAPALLVGLTHGALSALVLGGQEMNAGRLVLVSGVSGAGKTLALQTLEDIGYFCIDNLPPSMLSALRERVATGQRVAVVVDTRANEPLEDAEQVVLQMRAEGVPIEVLFLDCADEVLVRRFKETRRPHPLASREPSLPKAIHAERALLAPLKAIADHALDTSLFKPQDLRDAIRQLYADEKAHSPLRVRIVSFGFKYGVPADADLVFDVRFLRNPHYVERLKPKPGTDPAVREYVLGDAETQEFLETMRNFLAYLLPRYEREGKAYLTVGIGCTGGRHRSVVLSEALEQWFAERGYRTTVEHRDLTRGET